jgi:large subunit ribosomal protein L25
MADVVTIQAEAREPQKNKGTGTRVARRLRAQGRVPAIIYGHKQTPVPITLARTDVALMIKRASHIAELRVGDLTEMVLVREVQWDHLGKEIIHLDFSRVRADESIETEVRIELHGTPPGLAEGGTLEQLVHSLKVTCRANAIPDTLRVEIGGLHVDEAVHVRDLVVPEGVILAADPELLIAHLVAPAAAPEPTAAEAATVTQPELIRARPEEKDE